jgi:hypothetical protein
MTNIDDFLLDKFGPENIMVFRNPVVQLKGFVVGIVPLTEYR